MWTSKKLAFRLLAFHFSPSVDSEMICDLSLLLERWLLGEVVGDGGSPEKSNGEINGGQSRG